MLAGAPPPFPSAEASAAAGTFRKAGLHGMRRSGDAAVRFADLLWFGSPEDVDTHDLAVPATSPSAPA